MSVTRRSRSLATACAALVFAGQAVAREHCFPKPVPSALPFRIFQTAPPPKKPPPGIEDRAVDFPYFPGTDYAAKRWPKLDAERAYDVYYLLWSNRCTFLIGITPSFEHCRNVTRDKGNDFSGMERTTLDKQVRPAFSTYEKANACTQLQAARILGSTQEASAELAAKAGLEVVQDAPYAQLSHLAKAVSTTTDPARRAFVDICILPAAVDHSALRGILLDFEVFDDRLPRETINFLDVLGKMVKSQDRELIVATNPLPRLPNGIVGESARWILSHLDGLVLPVSTGATEGNVNINYKGRARARTPQESYAEQVGVLTSDGRDPLSRSMRRKLLWSISLYDTALDEARLLRDTFVREGYGGISIFRHYVRQGGSCERQPNQLIACLAYGVCDGSFKMQ